MKVLFLVQKEQRVILDRFYDSICRHLGDCDLRWLSSSEQANLKQYFHNIDVGSYDRIIFFLRFKKEIRQVRFIRSLPNLVILEHDAYQNYILGKYQGKFSSHYHKLPWARVICSGYEVSEKLRSEGVDVAFVPKGYDQALLANRGIERDIELGFLGSLGHEMYSQRRALLETLAGQENMVVTRTQSGDEYVAMLNRIRIFVGADVGFGEYMIKNFEAMACGCLLLTWNQGEAENRALGFRDMENVVLYYSLEELREKLNMLRSNPGLIEQIAGAGQQLVEKQYSWEALGARVAEAIAAPMRRKVTKRFLGFKRYVLEL
jgi:glycosyltransferase involved in cell wall biosynthesis